jgi:proline dehydrogenase
VPAQTPSPVRRLLGRPPAAPAGTGPRLDEAVRAAAELVAGGCLVDLEHRPGAAAADPAAELRELAERVAAAGLAAACELTVPVDRVGLAALPLARAAMGAGLSVALDGEPALVDDVVARVPAAAVVVPAGRPGAEARCRQYAGARVRLTGGRGAAADLAFVRCLTVLMAGPGRPAIGTTDPRLVAIAGERAAWNERAPDTWEYVMPHRVRSELQRRLVAGGHRVRVAVPSGEIRPGAALRRLAGRR